MMQKLMKKRLNSKGFTLVELVVVIAILGILAAIAVPRLLGFQTRARAQADRQSAVQVRNALALLYANGEIKLTVNGTYKIVHGVATTSDDSVVVAGITATATGGDVEALVEELTGTIDVEGTQDIIVTAITADGEIQVTQPAGIT